VEESHYYVVMMLHVVERKYPGDNLVGAAVGLVDSQKLPSLENLSHQINLL